jgi:hypothetical protein
LPLLGWKLQLWNEKKRKMKEKKNKRRKNGGLSATGFGHSIYKNYKANSDSKLT